jgi:hypothetical protein
VDPKCSPNTFIIITDEADQVIADWKERDPRNVSAGRPAKECRVQVERARCGLAQRHPDGFRWQGVNDASMLRRNGNPANGQVYHRSRLNVSKPSCPTSSRITAGCWEHINAVVVLVDARQTGKVTLAQLADFISVVSLSQIDLSAASAVFDSILQLFAQPRPDVPPRESPSGTTPFSGAVPRELFAREPAARHRGAHGAGPGAALKRRDVRRILLAACVLIGAAAHAGSGNTLGDELRIFSEEMATQCSSVKEQLESFRMRADPLTGYNLKDAVQSLCVCLPGRRRPSMRRCHRTSWRARYRMKISCVS